MNNNAAILASLDMLIAVITVKSNSIVSTDLDDDSYNQEMGEIKYASEIIPYLDILRTVICNINESSDSTISVQMNA